MQEFPHKVFKVKGSLQASLGFNTSSFAGISNINNLTDLYSVWTRARLCERCVLLVLASLHQNSLYQLYLRPGVSSGCPAPSTFLWSSRGFSRLAGCKREPAACWTPPSDRTSGRRLWTRPSPARSPAAEGDTRDVSSQRRINISWEWASSWHGADTGRATLTWYW